MMPKMPRGIYLLPSLFTAANMLFGMLSILYAIRMDFVPAAWCIMLAIIMDMMDGRIARWTKTTSDFGVEFDSLSDLVSFCVAPSVLMYQLVLFEMGRIGAAIAFFYLLCGALRLARFNVKAHDNDSNSPSTEFQGLPTPAAAALLASFVLSYELFVEGPEITVKTIPLIMQKMPFFFKSIPLTMLVISFLMVSEVPYSSFKNFKLTRPKTLQILLVFIIGIMLIITYPQNTIFIIFLLYVLSGLTGLVLRYFRLRGRFNAPLKDADTLDDKSKDTLK
jgi:CDP-diacylglycerol--serine O-phosphatidyltransferase